ncbi:MAG: hypothetical protein PUJ80_08850 [Verrucomicrobiota bacterium]|nr:hypothetical protein [Verrucomicrobiota bacterium]
MSSRKYILAITCGLVAPRLFSFTANRWQPVDGEWSGNYSDVRHWSLGRLPECRSSESGDDAVFENTSGSEIVITVDADLGGGLPQPAFLKIGSSPNVVKDSLSPVRFVGSGSLRQFMKESSFYVHTDGKVIFDDRVAADFVGIAFDAAYTNRLIEVRGNARLKVQNFKKLHASDTLRIRENGVLDVTLGSVNVDPAAPPTIDFASGKVFFRDGCILSNPAMLPRGTGILDFQTVGGADALKFTASVDQEMSGTLYATNAWGMKLEGATSELWGGGLLEIGHLYTPVSDAKRVVLDLARLNFGNGYYIGSGTSVAFPSDTTIGQFGADARVSSPFDCFFAKTLTLDTTDAHDGATPRTVRQFVRQSTGTLRVVGGGTAYVGPSDNACARNSQAVRAVEVAAGATLGLMTNFLTPFRFGAGTLMANARLLAKAGTTTYDFTQLTVDPSVKLEVDVAGLTAMDTQSSGNLVYPVLLATLGEGIPLANVTLKNNTGGWVAKKVGASVYLRNGAEKLQNPSPFLWTGAADGDWSEPGNWQSNAVPTSADTVFFGVSDRNNVVTIPAGGASIRAFNGAGLYGSNNDWYRSSEPYVFRGGKLTVCQNLPGWKGQQSAFFDCGRMPKTFENDVEFAGEEAYICPYHVVAFNGAFAANRLLLHAGDIRFGGVATIGAISSPVPKFVSDARDFSIHVMPGGALTVTDQSNGQLSYPVPLLVDGGASMTVNGTYRQSASSGVIVNVVDGRLAFAGEYVSQCDQTFAGTGRVDVADTRALANNVAIDLAGGVRFCPQAFQTVSQGADCAGASIRLRVPDYSEATVGALRDWVYGPADGAEPTTTASSRAFGLGKRSTLTVDTTDPDTQAGRKIAFADPIVGHGRVVVVGKGALILKTAESSVDELDVSEGTLDVDPDLLAASGYTEVLTAKKITGLDGHLSGRLRMSISRNADGTVTLSVAPRHGLKLCIR